MSHTVNQACKDIIADYWVNYSKDNRQQFENAMKHTQMELIRYHFSKMDQQNKRRAVKTLKFLET